jgi:hypothetical protein
MVHDFIVASTLTVACIVFNGLLGVLIRTGHVGEVAEIASKRRLCSSIYSRPFRYLEPAGQHQSTFNIRSIPCHRHKLTYCPLLHDVWNSINGQLTLFFSLAKSIEVSNFSAERRRRLYSYNCPLLTLVQMHGAFPGAGSGWNATAQWAPAVVQDALS